MLSFPCFLPTAAGIHKRCNQALVRTVILLSSEFHRVLVSSYFYFIPLPSLVVPGLYGHYRVESFQLQTNAQSSRVTFLFTFFFLSIACALFSASTFL